MTLNEFKELLFDNVTFCLDGHYLDDEVAYDVCEVIDNTFKDTFYDGSLTGIDLITKTLDTTPQN
jgi:hypothetical protein